MKPKVLYLDNHLLVIHKPAGMLAQGDATGDEDVLTWGKAYLKARFNKPGNVFLGLVHRLDRPASGVMVLARTSKAAARLTQQFQQRRVNKRYMALVEGRLEGEGDFLDHLVKDDRGPRIVKDTHPKGKKASLSYESRHFDGTTTLVNVSLHTGRAHQIRLQFSSRGLPLLGDLRHGARHTFDGRNLALHAFYLAFEHPTQKTTIAVQAPPASSWSDHHPKWVEQLLAQYPSSGDHPR